MRIFTPANDFVIRIIILAFCRFSVGLLYLGRYLIGYMKLWTVELLNLACDLMSVDPWKKE